VSRVSFIGFITEAVQLELRGLGGCEREKNVLFVPLNAKSAAVYCPVESIYMR
jgi:hypothetical protein